MRYNHRCTRSDAKDLGRHCELNLVSSLGNGCRRINTRSIYIKFGTLSLLVFHNFSHVENLCFRPFSKNAQEVFFVHSTKTMVMWGTQERITILQNFHQHAAKQGCANGDL